MRIRTRLILFFLPIILVTNFFVAFFFSYNWYQQISLGFQERLEAELMNYAAHYGKKHLEDNKAQIPVEEVFSKQKDFTVQTITLHPHSALPQEFSSVSTQQINTHLLKAHSHFCEKQGKSYLVTIAPVVKQGKTIGWVMAKAKADRIAQKWEHVLLLVGLIVVLSSLVLLAMLTAIANYIAKPIQRLNQCALTIAAGQYGEKIEVQGPKEVVELSHTLSTMSECLLENINRLKENARLQEELAGEYESSLIVQDLMLKRNLDKCHSDMVSIEAISFLSEEPKGILLDFPEEKEKFLRICFTEAKTRGFEGMYDLLTEYKHHPHNHFVELSIQLKEDDYLLSSQQQGFPFALLWSIKNKELQKIFPTTKAHEGDFLFLSNWGALSLFENEKLFTKWLQKGLRVFAEEGIPTLKKMLEKQLHYLYKRKDPEEDAHIIVIQLL